MPKLPKFFIAENPMVDNRLFILHTRKPRFIAEVDEPEINVVEWIDKPNPDRVPGLMSRLGDWYQAYTDWEDNEDAKLN